MAREITPTDPNAWNNAPPQAPSGNNMRGKSDIRQPAGGIEFVNTKNEEMITYHYTNGAFLRFEKFATDLFIPVDYQSHVFGNSFETVNKNKVVHIDGTLDMVELGDKFSKTGDVDHTQKHGEQWLRDMKELHNMKQRFEIKRCKLHNHIDQAEGQLKEGTLAPCPIEEIEIKSIYTVKAMVWVPAIKAKCINLVARLDDNVTIYESKSGGGGHAITGGWKCFTCWGDGLSPSSQDGEWNPDEIKKLITSKIIELTDPLSESEKHFGTSKHPEGGTEIRSSNKNVVEHIGNVFNTMESYRKDPKGKLVPYGMKVDPFGAGVYPQFRESGLIERVHVDPVPGGSYHKNVSDKYTLTVGANGISMKTNGDFHMFGIQTNILSERTVINGNTEVVISGERVDLKGDIITLRPRKVERTIENSSGDDKPLPANAKTITEPEQQVLIDGNLNVAMNMIVAGGAHIEGEVTLHHITAPCEYQITETDFEIGIQPPCGDPVGKEIPCVEDVVKGPTHADILEGCIIGRLVNLVYEDDEDKTGKHLVSAEVESVCASNSVMVHPHYHWFKNLPLKLIRDNTEMDVSVGPNNEKLTVDPHSAVRAAGARNNFAIKQLPRPVHNSKTNNTVIEKFQKCGKIGTIKIDNTNWEEPNKNNTKHRGNGIATQNSELLEEACELIKKFLEQKYECFKNQLENESSRKPAPASGPNDGPSSLGSRVGPGTIGPGGDGHVGDTNLYVGVPDPEAEELADIINNIRLEEERLYAISNSCS